MPANEIFDGGLATQDEEAVKVYTINYDDELDADVQLADFGVFTITPVSEDVEFEADNEELEAGNRSVNVRLFGGEQGTTYTVKHVVDTNESPSQTLAITFYVLIT